MKENRRKKGENKEKKEAKYIYIYIYRRQIIMLLPPINPSLPQLPCCSQPPTYFLLPSLNLALASFPTIEKLFFLFSSKGAPPCNNATNTQTQVQATKPPPYRCFDFFVMINTNNSQLPLCPNLCSKVSLEIS